MVELPIRLNDKPHEALNERLVDIVDAEENFYFKIFQPELASEAQFNILVLLKEAHKPLTQNDLSRKLLVDKSNITGLLDRLESKVFLCVLTWRRPPQLSHRANTRGATSGEQTRQTLHSAP